LAKKVKKPTLEQIKIIHYRIIENSGQKFLELPKQKENMIESALDGIEQGFGKEEFYPTICDKAIHLLRSIQSSQAFPDGNKRVALAVSEYFLRINRSQVNDNNMSQAEKVAFVYSIAKNKISKDDAVDCCKRAIKA
jgi:prophage maintenance system killer protein